MVIRRENSYNLFKYLQEHHKEAKFNSIEKSYQNRIIEELHLRGYLVKVDYSKLLYKNNFKEVDLDKLAYDCGVKTPAHIGAEVHAIVFDGNINKSSKRYNDKDIFDYYAALEINPNIKDFSDYLKEKENLSKQKNMKNILVKVENKYLVNYVYNKLRKGLNVKPDMEIAIAPNDLGKFNYVSINSIDNKISILSPTLPYNTNNYKVFIITSASNTDTIIEEVIKEYNKPEYPEFPFGGYMGSKEYKVGVDKNIVIFKGEAINPLQLLNLFETINDSSFATFRVGGDNYVLFTQTVTGEKIYASRQQVQDIANAIRKNSLSAL